MWKVNLKIFVAVCIFIMALTGQAADGATITVANDGGPADFTSIQPAIDYADNGDEIEVRPGAYLEAINFNGKAVRLYSSDGPYVTIIDGSGHLHVVQCVSGEGPGTILEGFTITGGNAQGSGGPDFSGGGMLNSGSSPSVTNCIFTGNTADYGGGMYNGYGSNSTVTDCIFQYNTARLWGAGMFNNQSNPTVTNCEFLSNEADWDGGGMFNALSSPTVIDCNFINNIAAQSGGGMYSKDDSNSIVNNCTFSGNAANGTTTSMGGGGMYNLDNSNPMVTNCTFTSNSAPWWEGGGMSNENNSSPMVNNCMFSDNTAVSGGGMHNTNSSPTLTNCILINNTASWGGGLRNYDNSNPMVTNCTFSGNSAGTQGGGMYNSANSNPLVTNCILWGDTPNEIYNNSSSPTVNYSDVEGGYSGTGNIDADPFFVNPGGSDLRLSSSASGCVDTGANGAPGLPATDLAGNPRIVDGDRDGTATVDMGAYEFQSGLIHNITQDRWYESIQVSIDDAYDGDQIEVGPGTYYEAINFKGKAIRLYSSGGQDVTTIDGTGHYHVVQCVSGEDTGTILEGFTITDGNAAGDGSGYPYNHTYFGGGMYNSSSSPTVTNCIFSYNTGYYGGGMYNSSSSPTVTNCTFSGNSASQSGGGMYNFNSSSTVTNCTFSGNTAQYGGGMRNDNGSSPTVTNCTFSGNSTSYSGGGMYNSNSSSTVTNCTFSGNSTSYSGGGMYNFNSSSTVTNCTFSGNTAQYGGGMFNYNYSSPTVTNCILWGNTPEQIVDLDSPSSTTSVFYSDVQGGWPGTGNINADPCYIDAAAGDLRLKPNSPCIDAGDSTLLLTLPIPVDLDGNVRCFDVVAIPNTGSGPLEFLDMGAYEFQCSGIGGDVNCDGVVDFKDLAILCGNWLAGTEPEL